VTDLRGAVYDSYDAQSRGLADARIRFVDEASATLAETETGPDGSFRVQVPAGDSLFAVIEADGYATTVFPSTGLVEGTAVVEDHALYGVSVEDRDGWLATWAGCAGADAGGSIVVGQVKLFGVTDPVDGHELIDEVAVVDLVGTRDRKLTACYLDEDGAAVDPAAVVVGATGRFAVFGADEGLWELVIDTDLGPSARGIDRYPVFVPEGEVVVSPWFPAWATLPL
jgi:hypothetical protein